LEEADSILIDRWADLLASSSADPSSAHPRFVQLLSEMTVDEAELLRQGAFHCIDEMRAPNQAFCDSPLDYQAKEIQEEIQNWLSTADADLDEIYDHIISMFERPGVFLIDITTIKNNDGKEADYWSIKSGESAVLLQRNGIGIEVLYSLNLLSQVSIEVSKDALKVFVYYVYITHLGV
jgi:hypothetical protein